MSTQSSLTAEQLSFDFLSSYPVSGRSGPFGIKADDFYIPNVEDPGTMRLGLGIPILIPRSDRAFRDFFEIPYDDLDYPKYRFNLIEPSASIMTFCIDDTPTADSSTTCIEGAFKNLEGSWKSGNLVPLDWYSFVFLFLEQIKSVEKFTAMIRAKYKRYRKVTLVFADEIKGGPNKEPLYVLWEYNIAKGTEEFKLSQTVQPHCLERGETFIMACVERTVQRGPERFDNVVFVNDVQTELKIQSTERAIHLESDSRFAFNMKKFVTSGLTRDEFIRQYGTDAFVPLR